MPLCFQGAANRTRTVTRGSLECQVRGITLLTPTYQSLWSKAVEGSTDGIFPLTRLATRFTLRLREKGGGPVDSCKPREVADA